MNTKYEFIDAEKANYPVCSMCRWSGVSRSGFYDWASRPTSATAARRAELGVLIQAIFADSKQTYGYRRVHAVLARSGFTASPELVRRIMADLGLVACQPRPFRPTTTVADPDPEVPDLVGRDFTATGPGTKLVGDITYVRTWKGWAYLATVIDCYTRECIGWAIADHMRASLVCDALSMAARNYRLVPGCVFHSDHGTQYMSARFAKHAESLGVRRSAGRVGTCYDNALAESFNAVLKVERVHRVQYPTIEHARRDIARWIEIWYNRSRLHSSLGYRPPREVYENYINQQNIQQAA